MANKFAKTRKINEPYAIYKNNDGWEWRILKTYKQPRLGVESSQNLQTF